MIVDSHTTISEYAVKVLPLVEPGINWSANLSAHSAFVYYTTSSAEVKPVSIDSVGMLWIVHFLVLT